jgi:hypothetical protein
MERAYVVKWMVAIEAVGVKVTLTGGNLGGGGGGSGSL